MSDIVTKIGESVIQHGKYNDRIYLMKLSGDNTYKTIKKLEEIALDKKYSKIFAKVPGHAQEQFRREGYDVEASIPGFYNNKEDGYFLAKYFSEERKHDGRFDEINRVLTTAKMKQSKEFNPSLAEGFEYRVCMKSDVEAMADVYKRVFETYPFPIHDPEYIKKTMDENVIYFCVTENGKIVALSSAEMDVESENVEMTDFATLPDYRGKAFGMFLLKIMENEMIKKDIKTAYTIARALSYGMNITFSKAGYVYSGTLVNNTNISGHFESMNIWHKSLT